MTLENRIDVWIVAWFLFFLLVIYRHRVFGVLSRLVAGRCRKLRIETSPNNGSKISDEEWEETKRWAGKIKKDVESTEAAERLVEKTNFDIKDD